MKRSDKLAIEEQRAWELFVKHYRLSQVAWRRWERSTKRAERAIRKEMDAEIRAGFDLEQVKRDALAARPWPKRRG